MRSPSMATTPQKQWPPVLEKHSSQTRLFAKIVRQTGFRSIAKLIERITIRGFCCITPSERNASATWHGQHLLTGLPIVGYESTQCISPELCAEDPRPNRW